jgi:hypothetical protein
MPEKLEGDIPPEKEEFEDDEKKPEGELRTPEEMKGELKAFIEMHEFPNRMKLSKRDGIFDIDGNLIPPSQTLYYQPGRGVKMRGEKLYGLYMGDRDNSHYWVKIGDADYRAIRMYGYSKAEP